MAYILCSYLYIDQEFNTFVFFQVTIMQSASWIGSVHHNNRLSQLLSTIEEKYRKQNLKTASISPKIDFKMGWKSMVITGLLMNKSLEERF